MIVGLLLNTLLAIAQLKRKNSVIKAEFWSRLSICYSSSLPKSVVLFPCSILAVFPFFVAIPRMVVGQSICDRLIRLTTKNSA